MERIGIAASKIAKGNLLVYNTCVIMMSLLFSLILFLLVGSTVLFALTLIIYVSKETGLALEHNWMPIVKVCFAVLSVVVFLFNLVALAKNIKLTKH